MHFIVGSSEGVLDCYFPIHAHPGTNFIDYHSLIVTLFDKHYSYNSIKLIFRPMTMLLMDAISYAKCGFKKV